MKNMIMTNVLLAMSALATSGKADIRASDRPKTGSIELFALVRYHIEKASNLTIEKLDIRRNSAAC
jgi:hypothetical protein